MPSSSKSGSAKKKRTPKEPAAGKKKEKATLPEVLEGLDQLLREDQIEVLRQLVRKDNQLSSELFAASRYLPLAAERKVDLVIPFNVILQDPLVLEENPDLAADDNFEVKWEPGLIDGPTSSRFAVVDYDRDTDQLLPPATWDPERRKFLSGDKEPTTDDLDTPQFRQINVWAMLQYALAFFEGGFGLGRPIPWGFEGNRLKVVPHAGHGENAFYDRASKSLKFYYFGREGKRVYTCLSADIVYHEFGHAVLDGVRPYFSEGGSVQTGAFHEFMGDITAILLSLRNNKFRNEVAKQTDGNLSAAKNLTSIAEQLANKTKGRPYLRTATNRWTMQLAQGLTSVHKVSQVMTGAMFDILQALTGKYLERAQTRFKEGATKRKPSVPTAFWDAIERMLRMTVQPLDLLPPVDVNFRDYALAVLRAQQLADPLDPEDCRSMILKVFKKRGILDGKDEEDLTQDRYLLERHKLRVYHDIDDISRSRATAYRFLHDNREELYIPLGTDFFVSDLYDANKFGRAAIRLPRQIVLQYIWREDVALDDDRFGRFKGQTTTVLCGGTIVFDGKGNILSWVRKPGTLLEADAERLGWKIRRASNVKDAWYAEVQAGKKRQQAFLDDLAARIASGEAGRTPAGPKGGDGAVELNLSPHLKIADHDLDDCGLTSKIC